MATGSKKQHRQAPIIVDGEVAFSVDKKLQSLIQFLWDNGLRTVNSCEDNVEGTCWIQYHLDDWQFVSEIAFRREPQDLYRFIEEDCFAEVRSRDDGYLLEEADEYIEGTALIWTASVRFPKELLPTFEKLVRTTLGTLKSKP